MKKVSAILCVLALVTTSAHAQDKSVRFGIKFAPNLGFINPDTKELKNDGTRFGYTFGLMGDFRLGANNNYAFSTGLYLNNVGGKFNFPTADQNLNTKVKYQYIEVPITLKLKTNEIGYMTYYGQIGFGSAFNIAAKADYDIYDQLSGKVSTITDDNVLANTNLFKASLIVGAGLEFNFSGNTSAMIGVTYNNGFTNILKNWEVPVGTENKELKAKQNYVELSLGVFF